MNTKSRPAAPPPGAGAVVASGQRRGHRRLAATRRVRRGSRVYPVSAHYREISELACYPAISTVPERSTTQGPPGLEAVSSYDLPNMTYPFGAYVCVVDVDLDSGVTEIRRLCALDDCGTRINPMIIEG